MTYYRNQPLPVDATVGPWPPITDDIEFRYNGSREVTVHLDDAVIARLDLPEASKEAAQAAVDAWLVGFDGESRA